jgi:hypothetical protein
MFGPDHDEFIAGFNGQEYLTIKISKAIIGKLLAEEYKNLPDSPTDKDFEAAKNRAQKRARMVSEIIVSGMRAQELANLMGDSIQQFQIFFNKYLGN